MTLSWKTPQEKLTPAGADNMSAEDETSPSNGTDNKIPSLPDTPIMPAAPSTIGFTPLVTVVGFHHARGPEVEDWFGVEDGFDPAVEYGWSLLPFMALSDGAHA